jgi:hypothetical protein
MTDDETPGDAPRGTDDDTDAAAADGPGPADGVATDRRGRAGPTRRGVLGAVAGAGALGVASGLGAAGTGLDEPSPLAARQEVTAATATVLAPDVSDVTYFETLTFVCLQAFLNADGPRVFLRYGDKRDEGWYTRHPIPDENVWLPWYAQYPGVTVAELADPYDLFDRLSSSPFEGYVVVDDTPGGGASANVAANYAALEDLLPVTATQLESGRLPTLGESTATDAVVHDLRTKQVTVDGTTGTLAELSRTAVYRWVYETQWTHPAASRSVLNTLDDPAPGDEPAPSVRSYAEAGPTDAVYLRVSDVDESTPAGADLYRLSVWSDERQVLSVVPGDPDEAALIVQNDGSTVSGDRRVATSGNAWTYELDVAGGADWVGLTLGAQYRVEAAPTLEGPYEELLAADPNNEATVEYRHVRRNAIFTANRIRDLAVVEGAVTIGVASADVVPEDGSGSGSGETERAVKDDFLADLETGAYVLGWHSGRADEFAHIRHLSTNGAVALGSSSSAANVSFHRVFEPPAPDHDDAVAAFADRASRPRSVGPSGETVYLTFVLSDGDALTPLTRRAQGGQWLLDARGDVEFGWELPPELADLGPAILDYFRETATGSDHFTAGPSGGGYFYPEWVPESDLETLLARTRASMARVGLRSATVMSPGRPVSDAVADAYHDVAGDALVGVMEGYANRANNEQRLFGATTPSTESIPVDPSAGTAWQPTALAASARAVDPDEWVAYLEDLAATRSRRPLFVPVHVPEHVFTIADVKAVVDRLDPDTFEVVGVDEFHARYAAERPGAAVLDPPESEPGSARAVIAGAYTELAVPVRTFGADGGGRYRVRARIEAPPFDGAVEGMARVRLPAESTAFATVDVAVPQVATASVGEVTVGIEGPVGADDPDAATLTGPLAVVPAPTGPDGGDEGEATIYRDPLVYEARDANHDAGTGVADPAAMDGRAWRSTPEADAGSVGNHAVWYPTRDQDDPGSYVALFRLKVDEVGSTDTVCVVDAVENVPVSEPGGPTAPTGPSRTLAPADFDAPAEYQWVAVPFDRPIEASVPPAQMQYRVDYRGAATLWVDRVVVAGTDAIDPGTVDGQSPTDPDGDGRFEDVDGDGAATYDDVVDLFEADADLRTGRDAQVAFDFNGNGRLDLADVVSLFESL